MSTKIEWADVVWNPVTGCTKVSQGCRNCYAEVFHKRLQVMKPDKYNHGFFEAVKVHPDELDKPKSWKKPARVFVNSMSDLFHEKVEWEFTYQVFKVMAKELRHEFLILTKRPAVAEAFFQWLRTMAEREADPSFLIWFFGGMQNIRIGVSVENQEVAADRIEGLLRLPVMNNFVSCEPLIGPLDLRPWIGQLNWVIAGGESGHYARPCHPDWLRAIRDLCQKNQVAFFFKQWGTYGPKAFPLKNKWMIVNRLKEALPDSKKYLTAKQHDDEIENWRLIDISGNLITDWVDISDEIAYPVQPMRKQTKNPLLPELDGVMIQEFPKTVSALA